MQCRRIWSILETLEQMRAVREKPVGKRCKKTKVKLKVFHDPVVVKSEKVAGL